MKKNYTVLIVALTVIMGLAACRSTAERPSQPEKFQRPAPEWGPHLSPEMIWVKEGSFLMGSDDLMDIDARPVHEVTMSGFYMSKNLITQAQYHAATKFCPFYFYGKSGSTPPYIRAELPEGAASGDILPAEQVTWFDAVEFCNKLSLLEGYTPVYTISNRTPAEGYPITEADITADWNASGYRLPTEAEWEYAAKGGNGMGPYFIYSGSDDPDAVAWFNNDVDSTWKVGVREALDNAEPEAFVTFMVSTGHYVGRHNRTYPVGTKAPNSLGIYDLSGNVWEWCWDWFGDYTDVKKTDPKGPDSGDRRVKRGGAASEAGSSVIRISNRDYYFPFWWYSYMGFRVVRSGL